MYRISFNKTRGCYHFSLSSKCGYYSRECLIRVNIVYNKTFYTACGKPSFKERQIIDWAKFTIFSGVYRLIKRLVQKCSKLFQFKLAPKVQIFESNKPERVFGL